MTFRELAALGCASFDTDLSPAQAIALAQHLADAACVSWGHDSGDHGWDHEDHDGKCVRCGARVEKGTP